MRLPALKNCQYQLILLCFQLTIKWRSTSGAPEEQLLREGNLPMSYLVGGLVLWFLFTLGPLVAAVLVGLTRIRRDQQHRVHVDGMIPNSPVEILVPIKGRIPGQATILESLLEQRYPNYQVVFVLENEEDSGNAIVDELRKRHSHARKVISGITQECAQKNHSLIAGVRNLRPQTDIIVFCDSTNAVASDWLDDFTAPLRSGEAEVVTTFRAFDPRPATLAGVCQAIYASFVLILLMFKPKPWGGATGILRRTFESLNVADAWSHTVVDDLVLGNILDRAGIQVRMTPGHLLRSPLPSQTIEGFLAYLDRQILFPKFTNPGIWLATLIIILSLVMALILALAQCILYPLGFAEMPVAGICYAFLAVVGLALFALRTTNPFRVSAVKWAAAFLPLLGIASFVYLRSIVVNHIDWHGRRYHPGKGGVVVCATTLTTRNDVGEIP